MQFVPSIKEKLGKGQSIATIQNMMRDTEMCFAQATAIDNELFGKKDRRYWTFAYGVHTEGQAVYRTGSIIGTARNVGIFTFDYVETDVM